MDDDVARIEELLARVADTARRQVPGAIGADVSVSGAMYRPEGGVRTSWTVSVWLHADGLLVTRYRDTYQEAIAALQQVTAALSRPVECPRCGRTEASAETKQAEPIAWTIEDILRREG